MSVLRSTFNPFYKFHDPYERIKNLYDTKTISYGFYKDYYFYSQIKLSFSNKRADYTKSSSGTKENFSLARARENVYRIAAANVYRHGNFKPIFFTLTTKDQLSEHKISNRKIKSFIRRFNTFLGYKIKYIIIPEAHKSGAIHYHGIFFNMPYVDIIYFKNNIWKHGYVDLQLPKKIKNTSAYLAKYMSKDYSTKTPLNTKLYFTSRGLYRPEISFDYSPVSGKILSEKQLKKVTIIKTKQND